jgi:methionyl-tRNA formyltransferase
MRIVFFGSGAFGEPTLRWLDGSDVEIAHVITQPPRPSGRGRRLAQTPIGVLCRELELPASEVEDVNDASVIDQVRATGAQLGIVVAFGQFLAAELLSALPAGFINLHASLLPKYRGAAPINWAIVRGEQRTGCTVFRVVRRMDAGPILTSRFTEVKPEETAGELHDRLARVGVDAVQATLKLFAEGAIPQGAPQDDAQATFAPKLRKSDGVLDFDRPAKEAADLICGMSPWPGAAVRYQAANGQWERVTLVRARVAEDPSKPDVPPGTIDGRRYVAAWDRYVQVLEIKPTSGRCMTWREYVNGRHVAEGDVLVRGE